MSLPVEIRIAVVDYGLGNLFSVKHACEEVGMRATITSSHKEIHEADAVILPGVGAFGDAMAQLQRLDLVGPLRDIAATSKPLVGICLGLQLLLRESFEFGRHEGLGIVDGSVVRFDGPREGNVQLKVPQVGWNRVYPVGGSSDVWKGTLLEGLPSGAYMYFVHSFYAQPVNRDVSLSISRYGQIEFCSSLCSGHVTALQFHPERSGPSGLRVYTNLANYIRQRTKR